MQPRQGLSKRAVVLFTVGAGATVLAWIGVGARVAGLDWTPCSGEATPCSASRSEHPCPMRRPPSAPKPPRAVVEPPAAVAAAEPTALPTRLPSLEQLPTTPNRCVLGNDVQQIRGTTWRVRRRVVTCLLGDYVGMFASASVLPVERDGVILGLRVLGVRPGSAPAVLGIQNGDVLLRVNNIPLNGTAAAPTLVPAQPLPRIENTPEVHVELERAGQVRDHFYLLEE